ncbi:hypothetical protein NE237_008905 [Protea cynaroides]|uniref:Uncharacterized protein n=1 Tax=Protea cynaroides TaxID=273540 RepID=A0A9Q0KWQ2_9MAGN|nr:hypothetical protein NE237_008905 [Protea cynaroides]
MSNLFSSSHFDGWKCKLSRKIFGSIFFFFFFFLDGEMLQWKYQQSTPRSRPLLRFSQALYWRSKSTGAILILEFSRTGRGGLGYIIRDVNGARIFVSSDVFPSILQGETLVLTADLHQRVMDCIDHLQVECDNRDLLCFIQGTTSYPPHDASSGNQL